MELRRYLQVVRRRWKLVAFVAAATVLVAVLFTSDQSQVYQSSGTYVVRPRFGAGNEAVEATEALNRGAEINTTFARIARSDVVTRRAKDVVQASGFSTSGISVQSRVLPGTNIIEISATGSDPEAVTAYATALGEQTSLYLDDLREVFQLELLDTPSLPKNPEASDAAFTLVIATVFGALAGALLAFAVEYFGEVPAPTMNINDPVTGAYSDEYFRLRLRQELGRCNVPAELPIRTQPKSKQSRRNKLFTLALVQMHSGEPSEDDSKTNMLPIELRDAAQALMPRLRVQDVLAYVGNDTFAVVFPDLGRVGAERILGDWMTYLSERTNGSGEATLHAEMEICQCDLHGLVGDADSVRRAYEL